MMSHKQSGNVYRDAAGYESSISSVMVAGKPLALNFGGAATETGAFPLCLLYVMC